MPLSALRQYWHPDSSRLRTHSHPPILHPTYLMLLPSRWRPFWSLSLPAKAFTPWWRLLHDGIGFRARLYHLNSTSFLTPLCGLCHDTVKYLYHFVVGCHVNSNFWFDVIVHFHIQVGWFTSGLFSFGST